MHLFLVNNFFLKMLKYSFLFNIYFCDNEFFFIFIFYVLNIKRKKKYKK